MASPSSSADVYIDPDFVVLRYNRPSPTQRHFPPLGTHDAGHSSNTFLSRGKHIRVHFEEDLTVLPASPTKRHKAASMASSKGSSVCIDPVGLHGPLARPILNTTSDPHAPKIRSYPSRPLIASPVSEQHNGSDPWSWPRLSTPSKNKESPAINMNIVTDDAHGRPLTKRQLVVIRKIVCRPPKVSVEGKSKAVKPLIRLDIPPLHSTSPSEVSDDYMKARSAWNYPRLEALPQKPSSRPNTSRKRSAVRKAFNEIDPFRALLDFEDEVESQQSELEPIPESLLKSQQKQKGKQKGKHNGKHNGTQPLKQSQNSRQNTKQSKKQVEQQVAQIGIHMVEEEAGTEDGFHASHLYGGFNETASTEKARLPTPLLENSPTPASKFDEWDMEPNSSPPLGPMAKPASFAASADGWNTPESRPKLGTVESRRSRSGPQKISSVAAAGAEDDWATSNLFEEPQQPRNEGSRRSKISSSGSQKVAPIAASATDFILPDAFHDTGLEQKSGGSLRSKHTSQDSKYGHRRSKKAPSVAAGSIAWGESEGIEGAGAELFLGQSCLKTHEFRNGSDRCSQRSVSRDGGSRKGSLAFGGGLATILEDQLLTSPRHSVSSHKQAAKSDGRQAGFREAVDTLAGDERSRSNHGSHAGKSKGQRSESAEFINKWGEDELGLRHSSKSGSFASCDAKTEGDREHQDRSLPKHNSRERSHGSESQKNPSPAQSNRQEKIPQEEDGSTSRQSHQSLSDSRETLSKQHSRLRSNYKRCAIAESYVAPTIEQDPENWSGWNGDDEERFHRRSKNRSHKSQPEAAVEDWLQGSAKEHSKNLKIATSIGSTATSSSSANPYAPSYRNDPLEAWGTSDTLSDASVETGYGRRRIFATGSADGTPRGFANTGGDIWSQSGCEKHAPGRERSEGGSKQSSGKGSAMGEAPASAVWTETLSSEEGLSNVSSRYGSAYRPDDDNWSHSGRVKGETGRNSTDGGSRQSPPQSFSGQENETRPGGSSSRAKAPRQPSKHNISPRRDDSLVHGRFPREESSRGSSRKSSSMRRDASPIYDDRARGTSGDGWNTPSQSSRGSAISGPKLSRQTAPQDDDDGWGAAAQDGDWGDVATDGAGWNDGGVRSSKKSGSARSRTSRKGGNAAEGFF